MVGCSAAQETGMSHYEYIDRNKEKNIFTPRFFAWIQPNLLQRCLSGRRAYIPSLKQLLQPNPKYKWANFTFVSSFLFLLIFFFILHTCIFYYKMWTYVPIELKLGTHKRFVKAHLCNNFGNPMRIYGNYSCKIRSKVCHAYKVNHLQEWVKIWDVQWVTIRAVPF